jgi:hypothetical protein
MGRPPKPPGARRSKNRTFRVRGELDDDLQVAAYESGRSVSEEIEFRLGQSFVEERSSIDALVFAYGSQLAGLILMIAGAVQRSGPDLRAGNEQVLDSPEEFRKARDAVERVLRAVAPPGAPAAPSTEHGLDHYYADYILNEIAGNTHRPIDLNRGLALPVLLVRRLLGPEIVERISKFVGATA